jgi:hypothetical protein
VKIYIPDKFRLAYKRILDLQHSDEYIGAFIFGSIARGDSGEDSDFDAVVIVERKNHCGNVNHPFINGAKLDISFQTYEHFLEITQKEIKKADRVPMLAESIIAFDKTGKLTRLKKKLQKTKPKKVSSKDHQHIQFMIYHATNKAERFLESDPSSSLLAMGININEVLQFHYKLQEKWLVSNKRLLNDLREWDPPLAKLLEKFTIENDAKAKFDAWSEITDYVLIPIGGKKPIEENNCDCELCEKDLKLLN